MSAADDTGTALGFLLQNLRQIDERLAHWRAVYDQYEQEYTAAVNEGHRIASDFSAARLRLKSLTRKAERLEARLAQIRELEPEQVLDVTGGL